MSVVTRELGRSERPALESHLLGLDLEDRRLRFGISLTDQAIRDYVAHIDFERDAVFGVFDDDLRLTGAAHLARGDGYAEFGVSVLPEHRGRGIGGALLERAHMHARNWGIRTLFVHCLAENGAMLHLARRQQMRIATEGGEADAYLDLAPADPASIAAELLAERVGLFDFALKSQYLAARRLAGAFVRPAARARPGPPDADG